MTADAAEPGLGQHIRLGQHIQTPPPEAAHHGPHQAHHLRGRAAGRLLQGGPPPHAGSKGCN